MAAGDHTHSNITGALGATSEHGYIRFFKEAYSDTIRLKSMALTNTLGSYVQREMMNGAPLQLRSVKATSDIGVNVDVPEGATNLAGYRTSAVTDASNVGPVPPTTTDGWNRAGGGYGAQKNKARFSAFDYYTIPTEYRTIIPDFWDVAHAYDWRDKKALMRDAKPDSQMMKSLLSQFERAIDRYIVKALGADVLINDGADTVPGTTTTTFTSDGGSTIDVDFGARQSYGGFSYGTSMSTAKLIEARRIMEEKSVIGPGGSLIVAMHPRQISHLLQDPEVQSYDFNSVRPLASGMIATWMGMTIVPTTQIFPVGEIGAPTGNVYPQPSVKSNPFATVSTNAGGGRYAWVFTPDAVILGADPVTTQMDVIPENRHMLQIAHYSCLGAIRMDGEKVLRIECVDDPATAAGTIPA